MGILQVLRLEFQKFRILEILNFHPCTYDSVCTVIQFTSSNTQNGGEGELRMLSLLNSGGG